MPTEKKLVATREVYGQTLCELGEKYPNLVVLDADLSASTKTCLFSKKYPERFFNMGVAEQDMISTAAGFATTGKIVFASTFAAFCTGRAWDQVKVSIAYPRLNVKIVSTHGGITVGEDGATHQALEDIALMRILANLTIIVPADAIETKQAIENIVKQTGPAYIRLSRQSTPLIYENQENYKFEISKGVTLKEGKDLTIIACGIMVAAALAAAEQLEKKGIQSRVINLHTIKPLDEEIILKAAKETRAIVTAEEHQISGGLGSAVAETLLEHDPVPIVRVGVKNIFAESGKPQELLEKYGMTSLDVIKAAETVITKKK